MGHQHGSSQLTPIQCIEVLDHVKTLSTGRNYEIRLLVNGFQDRLQYEAGHSQIDWRDMIAGRMLERAVAPVTRATITRDERSIALDIKEMKVTGAERLAFWSQRTGKGKDAFYRRLAGK